MPAIRSHSTATSDAAWDGPANEARLRTDGNEAYYRSAFAWQDPEGDPATKAAYRFVHHFIDADGTIGAASTVACQTGIGVLNGARGGTTIPDADRQGVYNHLARHVRDANLEPAELKSLRAEPDADEIRKQLPKQERRVLEAQVAVRAADQGLRIGGTIPFGQESEQMWGFVEIIEPSFFKNAIKQGADIRALWNHDSSWVLGRTTNQTLRLNQRAKELDWEADLDAEDAMHRHFARRIERRDVTGTSFGFETIRDEWRTRPDGIIERKLIEGKIYDISPVAFPAYPTSEAETRAACRFDVASTRCGLELSELADLLAEVRAGQLPSEKRAALEAWLNQLGGLLPPPPPTSVTSVDWRARVALHGRMLAA